MTPRRDPEAHAPIQNRSRETASAIVDAAARLLRERPTEDHSIADIAAEAGISVGGFYARFKTKPALLRTLHQHVLDDCRQALDQAMDRVAAPEVSAAVTVRAYVEAVVTKFIEHRITIRNIRARAQAGDGLLGRQVRSFNGHVHGRLRAALLARRRQIRHPNPEFAINFGLFLVSAGAREAILSGALESYPIRVDPPLLIDQLTKAYLAFLGISE